MHYTVVQYVNDMQLDTAKYVHANLGPVIVNVLELVTYSEVETEVVEYNAELIVERGNCRDPVISPYTGRTKEFHPVLRSRSRFI
jgi:hypothetical protein